MHQTPVLPLILLAIGNIDRESHPQNRPSLYDKGAVSLALSKQRLIVSSKLVHAMLCWQRLTTVEKEHGLIRVSIKRVRNTHQIYALYGCANLNLWLVKDEACAELTWLDPRQDEEGSGKADAWSTYARLDDDELAAGRTDGSSSDSPVGLTQRLRAAALKFPFRKHNIGTSLQS